MQSTKSLRRIASLAAGLLAAGLFTACTSTGDASDSATEDCAARTAPAEAKKTEINMWVLPVFKGKTGGGEGDYLDWANSVADAFEAEHPDVTVVPQLLTYDGYSQKIKTMLAAGTSPDVVVSLGSLGGVAQFERIGALEPLDCFLSDEDLEDFDPAAMSAAEFDGLTYMLPLQYVVSGMLVNLDLFEQAGATDLLPLDRENLDWTFDEFQEAADAVSNGSDQFGYAVNGRGAQFYNYLWLANNDAPMTDPSISEYLWDGDPKAAEALDLLKGMVDDGLAVGGAAGLDLAEAYNLFLQGKIAMMPGYDLATTRTDIENAGSTFELGVVAPPHADGSDTHIWTNTGGYMVFKQDDPYKLQMSVELAKLATDAENSELVSRAIGVFPGRLSARSAIEENPDMDPFVKLLPFTDNTFTQGYGLLTQGDWEQSIQSVLAGTASSAESLEQLRPLIESATQQ